MRLPAVCAVVSAGVLLMASTAGATFYPPPKDPGLVRHHPDGRHVTFRVCHRGTGKLRTIQRAIDLAAPGDTIRVCDGTYGEASSFLEARRRE